MQSILNDLQGKSILLTGATGGVGKTIRGILTNTSNNKLICISSKANIDEGFIQCDLVKHQPMITEKIDIIIHCACTYNRKKDIAMAKNLLLFSYNNNVNLFVYYSSWVVHSTSFYKDSYTRLKNNIEKLVRHSKVQNYLIIRPSLILGGGLIWDKMFSYLRYCQTAIPNSIFINPIHVNDVAELTLKLMANPSLYNQAYDFGTNKVSLSSYIENTNHQPYVNNLTKIPFKFLKFTSFIFSKLLSNVSSMGFLFEEYKNFNPKKIRDLFLKHHFRPIYLYENCDKAVFPRTVPQLMEIIKTYPAKVIRGCKGIDVLKHKESVNYISLEKLNRIIQVNENDITVEAGTTLFEVCEHLKKHQRMLPYLPEYLFISIGSCLITPVHGSSLKYESLLDLVIDFQYLDCSTLTLVTSNNTKEIKSKIVITQVTLKHEPLFYCEKIVSFQPESLLYDFENFRNTFPKTDALYIQWYFKKKQIMIFNINVIDNNKIKKRKNILKFRHSNLCYFLYKYLLPHYYLDLGYKILAPINYDFSQFFSRLLIKYNGYFDTEIKVKHKDLKHIIHFIEQHKKLIYACGIRCARHENLWVEIIIRQHSLHLLSKLKIYGEFHCGKVVPGNTYCS